MYAQDHGQIATPVGTIEVAGDDEWLCAIHIGAPRRARTTRGAAVMVRRAIEQLEQWFGGERRTFELDLTPPRTSRGEVLRSGLIAVGYGDTMSYGELARRLDSSARAVGQLCSRNPFPIIVPCHRILAAGGALGPYSAGDGPATKRWLLDHEQSHSPFALTGDAA